MSAFETIEKKRREYEQKINETCAIAGKSDKAAAFIKRGVTGAECRAELMGNRVNLAEQMRRRLANGGGDLNTPHNR